MAHSLSAKKRIRQTAVRRLRNRYDGKTARNAVRKVLTTTDKNEAAGLLTTTVSMIDKLAKKNIIHANKAANIKSRLFRHVNGL